MDYTITNASGNEETVFPDFTSCGDYYECHAGTCHCDEDGDQ